jgi:hypothetical protein
LWQADELKEVYELTEGELALVEAALQVKAGKM